MDKCLYIAPGNATFVLKDVRLLSKYYKVTLYSLQWTPLNLIINYLKQLFYLLLLCRKYDIIVIMFAGHWSVVPTIVGKLFGIPVFIILGGTESVCYPEINYGSLRKSILKRIVKLSLQNATALLPVDESLIYLENKYFNNSKQGVKHFFPKLRTPIHTIHNGYNVDNNSDKISITARIQNSFIAVAHVNDFTRFSLKGLDLIVDNAHYFSNCRFTLIGIGENISNGLKQIPENVFVYKSLASDHLEEYYLKHEYVIQCSISEGFPNALAEAMSYGCIPIVSDVGAMPKIIDSIGFIVKHRDNQCFVNTLNIALALSKEDKQRKSKEAHRRITDTFNENRRVEEFRTVFSKYLTNTKL